jgi:hypothetical protein
MFAGLKELLVLSGESFKPNLKSGRVFREFTPSENAIKPVDSDQGSMLPTIYHNSQDMLESVSSWDDGRPTTHRRGVRFSSTIFINLSEIEAPYEIITPSLIETSSQTEAPSHIEANHSRAR